MSIQITLDANEFNFSGTYDEVQYTSLRVKSSSNGRIYLFAIKDEMKMRTMAKQMKLEDGKVYVSFGKQGKLFIGTYVDAEVIQEDSYTYEENYKYELFDKERRENGIAKVSCRVLTLDDIQIDKFDLLIDADGIYHAWTGNTVSSVKFDLRKEIESKLNGTYAANNETITEIKEESPATPEEKFMNDEYITNVEFLELLNEYGIEISYSLDKWCKEKLDNVGLGKYEYRAAYKGSFPRELSDIVDSLYDAIEANKDSNTMNDEQENDYDKYWSIEKFIFGIMKEYGKDNDFWDILMNELTNKYVNVSNENEEVKEDKPANKGTQPRNKKAYSDEPKEKIDMIAAYGKVNYIGDSVHVVFNNDKVIHTVKYRYRRSWSHKKYIDAALSDTGIKPGWDFRYGWEYAETNDKEVMLQ